MMADLHEVDRVFSTYREASWISRLGRAEVTVAGCPPGIAEVLALGQAAKRESAGAFSVHLLGSDGRPRLDPSGSSRGGRSNVPPCTCGHCPAQTSPCPPAVT